MPSDGWRRVDFTKAAVGERSQTYPRAHRLAGRNQFAAVYEARRKQTRGPLVIHSLANQLNHHRLGISISRKVGSAPKRNRIKRMLRESFRQIHREFAGGYDLVIVVRPHEPMELAEYQAILGKALGSLCAG